MFSKDSNNRKLSKEQIEFFKDTKVLDDKGNLLVCYHGTRAHFNSFKQTGIFNWFTSDEDYSDYFGDNHYEVYVNIKNPLYLGDIDDLVETEDEIEDESQVVKYDGDKYYLTTTILDIARNLDVSIEELLDIYFDNSNYNTNIYKITKTKEFFSLVEEKGYDGVFAYESGTPTFGTMYANQVKRVTNLKPTTNSKMNEAKLEYELNDNNDDILDLDRDTFKEYFNKYFMKLTDKEILEYAEVDTDTELISGQPHFVLKDGTIINVYDASGWDTHTSFFDQLIHNVFSSVLDKDVNFDYYADILDNYMNYFTFHRGWMRCNSGTETVDDRFYCVLPNEMTSAQYDVLEQFIDLGYQLGKNSVLVFCTDNRDSHVYTFFDNTTDEIIKKIKRYYTSGIFYESLEEDLTPEQQEYFKDSKVRDADGNLLVCYHGTPTPGFKEFNHTNSDSQFGNYKFKNYNVNYFTTDKKSASSYTEFGYDDGSNVYACYVNIVNPYIVNNKTEAGMRNSFNIKDGRLRKHQIDLFNKVFKKWNEKVTWEYDSEDDFGYYELDELNDDLRTLNLELRPDGDYYSLYTLGNNSFWGAEHPIEPQYTIMELFDDDMYEQLYEDIIGTEEDDYVFSTDDVVKYVLSLNKNEGTDYDGIIIPDIVDSKEMFSFAGTDIITLKSSNQIKKIDNLNPTSSNRIDEDTEFPSYYTTEDDGDFCIWKGSSANEEDREQSELVGSFKTKEERNNYYINNILPKLRKWLADNPSKEQKSKRKSPEYLYRGTSERSFSKNYEAVAGLFFSTKRKSVTGWGNVKRYWLKNNAKIYQEDDSSGGFCTDYYDKKYPELKKYFGVYFDDINIEKLRDFKNLSQKQKDKLEKKVEEIAGNQFCWLDVWTWCSQLVARIELEKQGYDGAKWTAEDFGNPVQYQIWNLDVLKSYEGQVESFEESINDNYNVKVYRVDSKTDEDNSKWSNSIRFFADSLDYYDNSDTGYNKKDTKEYLLNLKDAKVFDPMVEWRDDLDVESWWEIRTTEEFCEEKGLYICDYLDGVDYDDPDEYHEVLIDTDSLAEYGRANGYDITILRDIPLGRKEFTEYAVHNSRFVKLATAKKFDKNSDDINESQQVNEIKSYTCGYVLEDGSLIEMDEYHGEDASLRDEGYPEYSNTHPEEDTCIRIYKEPNSKQYETLEKIIDKYFNWESYCKLEIWTSRKYYDFYKVYSLYDGACQDSEWDEKVGNWTGYDLIKVIKQYFINSKHDSDLTESREDLEKYYDEELFRQIDSINKFLGGYGFEVELVTDEDCLQELVDEDIAGMFFSSIQDNASVFPIGLNKKMICDESENTTDVYYGIVGTLSHEVGHGIFRYCNDILDLDDLDEEEVVEEFARDYEDNYLEQNELMNILKQVQEENIEESLQESKADLDKFRQWAGDELATKFFKLKDRLEGKRKDIYYWMKQSKEYLSKYLDELEKVPTKREINQKGKEGAEKVYEDDEWRVYKILSYEGAVKYGKNTQWCLSGSNLNTNELSGRDYFDRYSENDIYFYINKKNNRKYALVIKENYWTLYDEYDWEQVGSWMGYGKIDSWNPYEASKPHFPDVKGLPDINAEYDYAEREIKQQYGESYLEESREEFFKDSKIKDAQGNLIKVYHGSPFEFEEKKFKSYTNWFSESEEYSKNYGVTKEYYLNCKNYFDCGNTDKFAFNSLKAVKPYICNSEWRKIITDLNLSANEQIKLYKDVLQEKIDAKVIDKQDDADLYLYKIRLYSIVNTKAFAELVKSRGYDSIKTLEDGKVCYGVFNSNQVKAVDNENPTEKDEFDENLVDSEDENVAKLYDESISDLSAFYKLRDL